MRRRALGSFEHLEERCLLATVSPTAKGASGDRAGDSWRDALDLGAIERRLDVRGAVGGKTDTGGDFADWFRFSLDEPAPLSATLAPTANLDLYLFEKTERSWRLRGNSTATDSSGERIEADLAAGVYFLLVLPRGGEASAYDLHLSAVRARQPQPGPPEHAPSQPNLSQPDQSQPAPVAAQPLVSPTFSSFYGYGMVDASAAVASALGVATLSRTASPAGAESWNLTAVGAQDAWASGATGEGIVVAVIDSGVDTSHPEFRGQIFANAGEIAGDRIDNDGNGYIDDVHGWDFVADDNDPHDENGHGTHVASIIAAARDGVGVTGVAPSAKILPLRVLDAGGSGFNADVAKALRYAADLGAGVINLSLGGGPSEAVRTAIDYASARGAVVVIAAGNDGAAAPSYPAQYAVSSGIAVGAVDAGGNLAAFSNRAGARPLDYVTAPGVRVLGAGLNGTYVRMSGTSMAAPHVAGVAALVLSANRSLTPAQVEQLLIGSRPNSAWPQAVDAAIDGGELA